MALVMYKKQPLDFGTWSIFHQRRTCHTRRHCPCLCWATIHASFPTNAKNNVFTALFLFSCGYA